MDKSDGDQRATLVSRLKVLLERQGRSARMVSQDAGLSLTYISDLLSGKLNRPSMAALQAIATVLGTSVAFLTGEVEHMEARQTAVRAIEDMPLLGVIETGAFRSIMQASDVVVVRPVSQAYPQAKHFVLKVNDDAMSMAKEGAILPGMELLCVDMASADIGVESGKLYVIRHTMDGGVTYETILRRVMVYRSRTVLEAQSRRDVAEIILRKPLTTDESADIYAFGLVYGTFHDFE